MKNLLAASILMSLISVSKAHACDTLEEINWLLGSWQKNQPSKITTETWRQVSQQTFEGRGTSTSDRGTFEETLRITEMSGEIFYLAKTPGNTLPIAFTLQNCSKNTATFVNAEHDFPQKLEYRLSSEDTLEVNVSASNNKGFTLIFKSVK